MATPPTRSGRIHWPCSRRGTACRSIVCAPLTSVDIATPDGAAIPIERRSPDEITKFHGHDVAPPGTDAYNPSFDVTPAELITGIVTDEGVLRPPFGPALAEALERNKVRRAAAVPSAVPSADPVADPA